MIQECEMVKQKPCKLGRVPPSLEVLDDNGALKVVKAEAESHLQGVNFAADNPWRA